MASDRRPRMRFFEKSPGQRHIAPEDQYIYAREAPRFRLNIIGTGTIGHEHMRVATLLGRAAVHGIYDTAERSVRVAAENFATYSQDTLATYDSLEAACADPAADALMICTPNFTHHDVLSVAAKTGKPIFLEKPMATTLADAAAITRLALDYPSFIQPGLQYRYKAPYVEARHEVLERRSLGDVRTISMSEFRPPFLDKVAQWNKFSRFTGGTLVEKCCHYFDLINLFAGTRPVRVYASGGQAVNFRDFTYDGNDSDIDDHAFVIIDYAGGIRASFTLNMFCPHFQEELIVCGDQGRLVTSETFNFHQDNRSHSTLALEFGENRASRRIELDYPKEIEQSGHHGSTFYEHIAFVDQLEGKPVDSATALQGLWSVIVASAAQQSQREGAPVMIEQLINDNGLGEVIARAESGSTA